MASSAQPTTVFCAALPIACVDMFAQLAARLDSWVVVHNWRTWGLMVERGLRPERVVLLSRLPGAPQGSYLTLPADAWVTTFCGFLARVGAQRLVLFNHYRPPYREGAARAARELSLPTTFVERGPLSSHYYFDPFGLGPEGVLGRPEVWAALSAAPLQEAAASAALRRWRDLQQGEVEPQPPGATPAALRASLSLSPTDKLAFFPMQVDDDIQITRFSPWVKDMTQALAVISAAARAEGWRLLVKPHPRSRLASLTQQDEHVTVSPQLHVGAAVEAADAVITVNSGVGLEALTQGKTVLTLGQAIYTGKGLTLQADDEPGLRRALAQAPDWRPPMDLLARLASFLTEDYLLPYPLGPAVSRAESIIADPNLAVPRMLHQRPWPPPATDRASAPPVTGRRTALLLVAAREATVARAREELLRLAPDLRISQTELPRTWWRAAQRSTAERAALAAGIVRGRSRWRRHDVAIAVVDDTLLRPRAVRSALLACRAAERYWWCPGQPPLTLDWPSFRAREIGDWFASRRSR